MCNICYENAMNSTGKKHMKAKKSPENTLSPESKPMERRHILAQGQVQGVGFRPFIYRLALEYGLTGHVCNTAQGVHIEAQGPAEALQNFATDIQEKLPPLAQLTHFSQKDLPSQEAEEAFVIIHSHAATDEGHSVLISSDVSMCAECEAEMQDVHNKRHAYPFTNCTNCGPRYTITHSIPYDRATTSMACFPLCEACQKEYDDPLNRRFHAQPNACPVCGPKLWYVEKDVHATMPSSHYHEGAVQNIAALQALSEALLQGKIAAIKGLGGFHLACDAFNEEAIMRLRVHKRRPHKPFALMVENLQAAHALVHVGEQEESLLLSQEKPIVLCKRKDILPQCLAPDTDTLGIVLAYTPLHAALFHYLRQGVYAQQAQQVQPQQWAQQHAQQVQDVQNPQAYAHGLALVMTSGNAAGEPICLGNREAAHSLSSVAEVFLFHERDILVRNDDSVCTVHTLAENPRPLFLRRARGYVPRPLHLGPSFAKAPCVLGMGAELKSTLCLNRGEAAFVSQHVGDLQNLETLSFYRHVLSHMEMLLQVEGQCIVHDAHPDFLSTRAAQELAEERGIELYALQHHFAHAYAVLAEYSTEEVSPCLSISLDGTGYGLDGTIWGGELLYIDGAEHTRLGRLSLFALPGAEQAIREPWRIAVALAQDSAWEESVLRSYAMGHAVLEMVQKKLRSPVTSSAGRLFDGVAAALALCDATTYEGQAAIRLEQVQKHVKAANLPALDPCAVRKIENLWEVSSQELFIKALQRAQDYDVPTAACAFHHDLAEAFAHMAYEAAKEKHCWTVSLCGGAMQNATLHGLLYTKLQERGFKVLTSKAIPPNDGAISLGQVYYGLLLLQQRQC